MDNFKLAAKAFINQKIIFNYLHKADPEKRPFLYKRLVKRYWDNRSNSEISKFEKALSQVFNGYVKVNIHPSGLLTVDLDSKDVDKPSIEENYHKWQEIENARMMNLFGRGLLNSVKYRKYIDQGMRTSRNAHLIGQNLDYFTSKEYTK